MASLNFPTGATDGTLYNFTDDQGTVTQYKYVGAKAAWYVVSMNGVACTVDVGTTTTGNAGTNASVSNSGTTSNAIFDFTIPKGADGTDGTAATVSAGTTTTGAAGSQASVTNSGSTSAAVFNLTIPRGNDGEKGDTGDPGDLTGYATQSWVTSQGYLTTAPVTSVNSQTGAVSVTRVQEAYGLWNGSNFIGAAESNQASNCVVRDGAADIFVRYLRSSSSNSSVPMAGSELAYRAGGANDYTRFSSQRAFLRSITGVSFNTDHRNISNVEPITSATNIIEQLNPVMYDCEEEGARLAGFEAEALKSVVASAVQGEYDGLYNMVRVTRSDGTVEQESMAEVEAQEVFDNEVRIASGEEPMTFTPNGTKINPQYANYLQLIPVLTKALQEALTRIDELEAKIE